jgi:hypothetical protein
MKCKLDDLITTVSLKNLSQRIDELVKDEELTHEACIELLDFIYDIKKYIEDHEQLLPESGDMIVSCLFTELLLEIRLSEILERTCG